ncbi:helix-turn-helix domain-containing protein [Oscillospiraceae bacterium 42-9]
MLDCQKISRFIALKRKELGMTQAEIAEALGVTYQAVSKWENGTIPNVEVLVELARVLNISVDTLLNGGDRISYQQANMDLAHFIALKEKIAAHITTDDSHLLSGPVAHTTLYDFQFPEIESPVLVTNPSWSRSKCNLAVRYGYGESVGHDIVNDLVSNIIATGARPLFVTDCFVMGNDNADVLLSVMKGISDACKENGCSLAGGSTYIQSPSLLKDAYAICANISGVVSRKQLIDGHAICDGDVILAVASNGPHSTGYTLINMLIDTNPLIKKELVAGEPFLEQVMKPHASYYKALSPLLGRADIHGIVHHSRGRDHLRRILPEGLCAEIYLNQVRPLPIFSYIKKMGNITEKEMLSSYNCGMGMWIVAAKESASEIAALVGKYYDCYPMGRIKAKDTETDSVVYKEAINW